MKIIRSLHLYLGCIFGPMLMFFAISGSWQAFELHRGKPGYDPPESFVRWSNVHESQRLPWNGDPKTSQPFRYLMVCMAAGVVTTTLLGIIMAFTLPRKRLVTIVCLVLGFVLPLAMLWLGGGIK
jgi:hypothetical protein